MPLFYVLLVLSFCELYVRMALGGNGDGFLCLATLIYPGFRRGDLLCLPWLHSLGGRMLGRYCQPDTL